MLRSMLWLATLILVAATFPVPGGSAECHVDHASCDPSHRGVGKHDSNHSDGSGSNPPPPPPPTSPNCDSSNPNYNPFASVHVFVTATAAALVLDSQAGGVSVSLTYDTSGCATGDGDDETAQGGAQFPETSQGACDPAAPWDGHHNGGIGATATVRSNTANLAMDYIFGTDGQMGGVDVAVSPCTGNNVFSDSYDADPFDCGEGTTGHFPLGPSATLAPNANPHDGSATDPDPWATVYGTLAQGSYRPDPNGVQCFGVDDGSAWVFFVFGPEVSGLLTNPPLVDLEGCPVIGDGSSLGGGVAGTGLLTGPLAGNGECGLHGGLGVPTAGMSTPLTGTLTAP